MAEENKQSREIPTQVRLQVPSIILPSPNQSITVLSPAQQQKLGLDITQLISGQQLNLLASHLSGIPTNESSQPVIIVPEAVDNEAETALSSTLRYGECSTGTSHNISIPLSQEHSISIIKPTPSTSSTPARKGRPNKFIALESGEIIRQNTKTPQRQGEHKSKKPRGRPKKNTAEEVNSKTIDACNEADENINNNNKAKSNSSKRLRVSDSESDVAEDISKSDTENEMTKVPRLSRQTSSQHSQRPRRSVVKSTRYADYEVENLPQRPENVWITEKTVEVAETSVNEEVSEKPPEVVKVKRGRKKGWKLKKAEEMPIKPPMEDNVNCNEEESKDVVSCGACNTKMPRKTYKQHQYKKHNGLAWIEGEDKPIDFRDTTIENQNHLSNLIREAFSRKGGNRAKGGFKNSGKYLSCENCDHRCCSAAGYLSHFRFCQVSDEERLLRMWKCPLCKRMMMPSSRYSHENIHKSAKTGKEENEMEQVDNLFNEKEEKKPRRKAAVKAQNTIQETMDQFNPDLGGPKDPLLLGFRKPKESNKGIGAVRAAWTRQLETSGTAACRNMGCNFSSTDLEELQLHHLQECNLKPTEVFECLRCTIHCSSEAEVINHIATAHPNAHTLSDPEFDGELSDQLSEYEVSSGEEASTSKKRSQPRATKLSPEKTLPEKGGCNLGMGYSLRFMMPYWTFRNKVPYRPVLKWMLDFIAKNHSEYLLYPNLMKLAKLKPLTQPHLYKPDTQFSISFCTSKKPHPKLNPKFTSKQEWTSIPAFSGNNEAEVPLFFTGGPVISLAWCPTLISQNEDQILAVSTLSNMNILPKLKEATCHPGMIQLWNLGKLKNVVTSIKTPHFFMGLGHNWGVVREVAWCPSGCQAPQYHGLLAAACSDGTVRLIPIPKHNDNQLFFHAKCALTLLPHSTQETRCPCLRISWYPGKEHGYIAAGYVDGLVCLWKLKNPSQLLMNVDGNNDTGDELHPYLKFLAHTGPVTALEISSIGDGIPRYIFTGSIAEKNMTYWDLEKLGEISLGNFNRRSRITDATWMTLWPLATSCFEDLQSGTTFIPPRNFCRHFMILPQNSATLCVEKGDWLNGIAQSTVAGEISLMLLNQIIFGMDNEKLQREKRALLTRTCLASLEISDDNKSEQEENKNASFLTYEQIGQQGIVFCDVTLDSDNVWCRDSKSAQLPESMDSSPSVNYPITAINHIAWNPNASSFSWIAAGYQSGFVRILHVKCKSSDQIINSSIQKFKVGEENEEKS